MNLSIFEQINAALIYQMRQSATQATKTPILNTLSLTKARKNCEETIFERGGEFYICLNNKTKQLDAKTARKIKGKDMRGSYAPPVIIGEADVPRLLNNESNPFKAELAQKLIDATDTIIERVLSGVIDLEDAKTDQFTLITYNKYRDIAAFDSDYHKQGLIRNPYNDLLYDVKLKYDQCQECWSLSVGLIWELVYIGNL